MNHKTLLITNKRYFNLIRSVQSSIILHLLLFLFILHFVLYNKKDYSIQITKNSIQHTTTPITQKQQKTTPTHCLSKLTTVSVPCELPAKLRAPKSSFGWVVFDNVQKNTLSKNNAMSDIQSNMPQNFADTAITHHDLPYNKSQNANKNNTIEADTYINDQSLAQKTYKNLATSTSSKITSPKSASITYNTDSINKENAHSTEITQKTFSACIAQGFVNQSQDVIVDTNHQQSAEQLVENIQPPTKNPTIQDRLKRSAMKNGTLLENNPSNSYFFEKNNIVHSNTANNAKNTNNIIALTKGFIEKISGEEGDDLIDCDGDPNKKPNIDDLRLSAYRAKIIWCLQATWKKHFLNIPWKRIMDGKAIVEFSIDAHGNVIHVVLLQQTDYQELDSMIIQCFKLASPLPPIPQHFNLSHYIDRNIVTVRTQRFNF